MESDLLVLRLHRQMKVVASMLVRLSYLKKDFVRDTLGVRSVVFD